MGIGGRPFGGVETLEESDDDSDCRGLGVTDIGAECGSEWEGERGEPRGVPFTWSQQSVQTRHGATGEFGDSNADMGTLRGG